MRWILVFVGLSIAAGVAAAEPGHLWQVETNMEMPGMKMPGRSQQICAPVSAEGPEAMAGGDDECQMTNVRRSSGKFSYDVRCPQGSGTGEMTYQGKDSYTTRMTMTSEGRTMTMTSRAKRVGACDASSIKKQVAAAQNQANAAMAQACASVVETIMPAQLDVYQCEPRYKQELCRRLETNAGFSTVAARQPMGEPAIDSATLPEVARFCGVEAEGVRTGLCSEANRGEDFEFLATHCPAQAQVLAQRECAGRSLSSPPAARYREFCGIYARDTMRGDSGGAEQGNAGSGEGSTGTPAGDAVREGAKRLKGVLGF